MRNRVPLCIWSFCILSGLLLAGASLASPDYGYSDQPTVGGEPAFATKTDVMLSTINSLVQAKDYAEAEKLAEEVTVKSPQLPDGWMMLGYTRSLNGKYDLSNDAYDKAMENGADKKQVLLRKAYNCRKLNDAESARQCYEEILAIDNGDVDILMQFGAYESSQENYEEALRLFEMALKTQPENVEGIDAVSRVEEKLGDSVKVKYWLEKGIELEPENTKFLKRLASIYLSEQNYGLSLHYLSKLVAIDPNNAAAYRNIGIAYYQQGDKKMAKDAFEKVKQLGGSLEGLYGPLADCYRSTGQRSDALSVIKTGIDANNQKAWLYSIWGKILEDREDYDAAISKFQKAVALRDEPWSNYAKKQITRQAQLKKRAAMIAAQGANQ
jgi:tetratricopeptide (TPR) repeat protein